MSKPLPKGDQTTSTLNALGLESTGTLLSSKPRPKCKVGVKRINVTESHSSGVKHFQWTSYFSSSARGLLAQ